MSARVKQVSGPETGISSGEPKNLCRKFCGGEEKADLGTNQITQGLPTHVAVSLVLQYLRLLGHARLAESMFPSHQDLGLPVRQTVLDVLNPKIWVARTNQLGRPYGGVEVAGKRV